MGKSVSVPPAPDYTGAAVAQGAADKAAALASGKLSNPNLQTPTTLQTVTYTQDENGDFIPNIKQQWNGDTATGYALSEAQRLQAIGQQYLAQDSIDRLNQANQRVTENFNYNPSAVNGLNLNVPSQADKIWGGLDPSNYQQAIAADTSTPQLRIDPYLQGQATAANIPYTPVQTGVNTTNINTAQPQAPSLQNSLFGYGQVNQGPSQGAFGYAQQGAGATPNLQTSIGGQYQATGGAANPALSNFSQTGLSPIQSSVNTASIAAMPINAGTTAQQAIMSRLAPQLSQDATSYQTQLVNQGLRPGMEAYDNAMRVFNQGQNDLRTQAALQGINLDMAANQQGFGQQATQAELANQANAQQYQQGLGAVGFNNQTALQGMNAALQNQQAANQAAGQNFQQAVQAGEFGNAAQQAQFGMNMQNANLYNQGLAQNYGMAQNVAQQQNAAQQQQYNELLQNANLYNQALQSQYGMNLQGLQQQNAAAGQQFQQGLQAGNFANTAQQQQFQQALDAANQRNQATGQNQQTALAQQQAINQALAQQYSQRMGTTEQQNSAIQTNLNNLQAYRDANNQAQSQIFNQQLSAGQFQNAAQQQNMQQQLALRQLPLNEIAALMSGQQVQNPQFQAFQGAQTQAGNFQLAAQQQGAYNQWKYQQELAAQQAKMQGIGKLAGSVVGGIFGLG